MKPIRLALQAAALAAAMGANLAAAEENPVRQFLNEEFRNSATQAAAADTPTQVANVSETEQQPDTKKNANPWSGLTTAAAAPVATAIATNHSHIITLIDKHAAANGIPAAFARAIVRIESNFNPRATGRQREVGLMQIKYETARGIGFTGTREELYDPDTNLKWGMKYLAMSWKLGGATPCGAVLRYQAGHAATQPTTASKAYCAKVRAHMASAN